MRPKLKEGVRPLRRPPHAVQLGLDPERAVVIDGLEPAEYALLASLDGTRATDDLVDAAAAVGVPRPRVERMLSLLADAGLLDDASLALGLLGRLDVTARDRLRPDLATWALLGGSDGGRGALERRARSRVLVLGAARLGVTVARLLAASAVGLVEIEDDQPVQMADTAPGGFSAEDSGANRSDAARALVAADSPLPPALRPAGLVRPRWDAVVLAPEGPVDARIGAEMVRRRVPHLLVAQRETTGVVGPLVLPGQTACLHCLDLHRTARDRSWPAIAVQLGSDGDRARCMETTLVAGTASLAAMQVLALLDRQPASSAGLRDLPALDATLEVRLPYGDVHRRSWTPHPSCPCGADRARHSFPEDPGDAPDPPGRADLLTPAPGATSAAPTSAA